MIFVFGTKAYQKELPSERKVCPNCLSVTEHRVVEANTRMTLYFIPLFSVKREVTYTCLACGDSHTVDYAEYEAGHQEAQPVAEKSAQQSGPAPKAKPRTTQEKARAILEGRIVGDEIKTSKPLSASLSSDQILKYFYIALAIVAILSIALIALLVTQMH